MKLAQKILSLVEEYPEHSPLVRLFSVPASDFFYMYSHISPSISKLGRYCLEEDDDFIEEFIKELQGGDFESWWNRVLGNEDVRQAVASSLHDDEHLLDFLKHTGGSSPKDLQNAKPRDLIGFIQSAHMEWGLEGALKSVLSKLLRNTLTEFLRRALANGVESSIGTCDVIFTDENNCDVYVSKEDLPDNPALLQRLQAHPDKFAERVFDSELWAKKFGGSGDPLASLVGQLFNMDVTDLPGFFDELSSDIRNSATFDPWEVEQRRKRQ